MKILDVIYDGILESLCDLWRLQRGTGDRFVQSLKLEHILKLTARRG